MAQHWVVIGALKIYWMTKLARLEKTLSSMGFALVQDVSENGEGFLGFDQSQPVPQTNRFAIWHCVVARFEQLCQQFEDNAESRSQMDLVPLARLSYYTLVHKSYGDQNQFDGPWETSAVAADLRRALRPWGFQFALIEQALLDHHFQ